MRAIELFSSLSGSALFLILTTLLLVIWRGQAIATLLIASCVSSVVYFGWLAYTAITSNQSIFIQQLLEVFRSLMWLILLAKITGLSTSTTWIKGILPLGAIGFSIVFVMMIAAAHEYIPFSFFGLISDNTLYYGYLFMAITGLVLVEQWYRKTKAGYRWAIKYFCLGLGGIFFYEFVIYSDAVLFRRINPDLWIAKGAINAICVPLIAVSIRRIREWNMELFVSRHIIFQSSMMLMAGLYLSFMAVSGYYVRVFGGTWGGALQSVFLFTAILGLMVLAFSSDLRARLRIFLVKHFYENKYDYREEWLGFTRMFAEIKDGGNIHQNTLKAFSDIMRCNGGGIWIRDNTVNDFCCLAEINLKEACDIRIHAVTDFVRFLEETQWVINIESYRTGKEDYPKLKLPEWLISIPGAALVVPLFNERSLIGLVLLTQSDLNVSYNWEDYDLLKTMGHQASGYIALIKATEDLAQAKQFEAFNRLSAFVVHDIKNLVAQLSLVSSNAKKFRDNQDFLEDAFETIDNSVSKMNRLLQSLKKGSLGKQHDYMHFELSEVIEQVVQQTSSNKPVPRAVDLEHGLVVWYDREKLINVIQHLVQNAQEATPENGIVEVTLYREESTAKIRIRDSGTGMDQDFIRSRLFKPFDTTKGNAGMGIGVYESLEAMKSMGGDMDVISKPGEGTLFILTIPLT